MAIMDERTLLADAASVAAVASTILIGSQIDATIARDLGNGQPVYLCIVVSTSIITAGAAGTIQFILASDASAAIATDGSATEHWRSEAFVTDDAALNDLDAGETLVCIALPTNGAQPYERYLGLLAVIATTEVTAGAVTAWLSLDPIGWKAYPEGDN